jgi:hypothetical protein
MDRRLHLWLGVSAYALLGAASLPMPAVAGMASGDQNTGSSQNNDPDPHGGFQHECGEPGGCAEAGERFESRHADEFGEDEGSHMRPVTPARPLSGHGGLGRGDSVHGGVGDGGLGGGHGGLGGGGLGGGGLR